MNPIDYIKNKEQYIGCGKKNVYNKNASVFSYIEKQMNKTPHAVAIVHNGIELTYKQLNHKVNQLSNYLLDISITNQSRVAIYLEPGFNMIISILAILKLGCSYVPIDKSYPIERINFMLRDSESSLLITESKGIESIDPHHADMIMLDHVEDQIESASNIFHDLAGASDLAYMIYTSGSTGVPKGVMISHRAVNNHMLWMKKQFLFDNNDIILQKTPFSFDPSIWEILLPFYCGSKMVIAPSGSHIDPDFLIDLITLHHVTVVQFVPSILKLILSNKRIQECASLTRVFVGGESLRPEIKTLFFKTLHSQLINLYGPTETTIDITSHTVTSSNVDINTNIIGEPIFNTSLYVVNSERNLAKIGEEGELYIGSDNLSYGYHHREALTTENFIPNPFEPKKFKTIYKTGDLVRWLTTGQLEYLGRNNDQVKINGVRIEPKELVLTILKHHEVADCIVIKKIDTHGHDFLACYLTQEPNTTLDLMQIKNDLKSKFPTYMLPKVYIPIEKIPLTINGKVDLDRLPNLDFNAIPPPEKCSQHFKTDEKTLLLIWQLILETNQISLTDNFFDLGGGSLLAIKLISFIQEKFNVILRIRDIFSYQTIKEQADFIKRKKNKHVTNKDAELMNNPIIPLKLKGSKTPFFIIHPIGGTIFWYTHLAKLLGTERPVYGIQDPSIDIERPILNSIEEMAEFYLSHIKTIQPTGPYLIGGASFGATVAIEISKHLKRINEDVSSIIILDGWGVYPNILLDDNYFRSSMLRQHAELIEDFKKYGLPKPDVLFDIQWHRLNLLWKYHLDLIEYPIALFKSKEILPAFLEIDAPFNHWENFSNNKIHTFIVPGNHETMFQDPHVYELSNQLKGYFSKNSL